MRAFGPNAVPAASGIFAPHPGRDRQADAARTARRRQQVERAKEGPGGQGLRHRRQPHALGEIERAIYARMVEKVGNRRHWEDWAKDIATIAQAHVTHIESILGNKTNTKERDPFDRFDLDLRDDLNDPMTDQDVVEMLAQHLVTKPVFDAIFAGSDFAGQNSIAKAMQGMLDAREEHHLGNEADTLQPFYASVKSRLASLRPSRSAW